MKETILLTKHMRDNPEDSHLIDSYEKNNGYSTAKKTILGCVYKYLTSILPIKHSQLLLLNSFDILQQSISCAFMSATFARRLYYRFKTYKFL